jgi:ribosomal protein S7
MAADLVDNPFYARLEQAVKAARKDAAALERALNRPFDMMTSRKVWVTDQGGSAQAFQRDLDDQRRQLRSALRNIVQAAEDALSRTPRQVTSAEALTGGKGPRGAPFFW